MRCNAKMKNLSRRDFLKLGTATLLTASGLFGLGGLLRFLAFETEPPRKTKFDLGPAADYPIGSHTVVNEIPAIIFHRQDGFVALSLVCTHLGCTVEQKSNEFECPCHGSRYSEDGKVLRGPAKKGLQTLRVEINEDRHVILHTD